VESEARWVGLAKAGLAELDRHPRPPRPPDRAAVNAAIAHAKALAATDPAAADPAFRALEELAGDDPVLKDAIRTARGK